MSDIVGLSDAKRAIEAAAVEGHNIILVGPPGSGRTMLARRYPGIMPTLPECGDRAFRAPHHTVSAAGMAGEFRLAVGGVLYLDELAEFRTSVLLELEGAYRAAQRPFTMIATIMECPCGWYPDTSQCRCTDTQRARYPLRIPATFRALFETCVTLPPPCAQDDGPRDTSESIRARVYAERLRRQCSGLA